MCVQVLGFDFGWVHFVVLTTFCSIMAICNYNLFVHFIF